MVTYKTRYGYGDNVCCQGMPGIVTAVFIRDRGICYEFSYISKDGDPCNCAVSECLLTKAEDDKMGFTNAEKA